MDYTSLNYLFIQADIPDAYTLLLLHGTGGNENDLIPLANAFGENQNILSVRGNVQENGMPHFFRRLAVGVFDEQDVVFRTHELVHFIQEKAADLKINAGRIVALGFSNGANIAGAILMLYPDLLAGAILLRPMLPLSNLHSFRSGRHTPVFISSGAADATVNIADTKQYEELLKLNN